jgi:hypothetical protein
MSVVFDFDQLSPPQEVFKEPDLFASLEDSYWKQES